MFATFRRWAVQRQRRQDNKVFNDWADTRGYLIRHVRESQGCVIEAPLAGRNCRVEWGEAQRDYIGACELRLIADLDIPRDQLAVVLNRTLHIELEQRVYEDFVGDVQTRMDAATPAEMRWLVMFATTTPPMPTALKARFAAVGNHAEWLGSWLNSSFGHALESLASQVPDDHPLVLTVCRGRLMLRTAMAHPDRATLAQWITLFEHGVREALRMTQSGTAQLPPAHQPLPSMAASAEAIPPAAAVSVEELEMA